MKEKIARRILDAFMFTSAVTQAVAAIGTLVLLALMCAGVVFEAIKFALNL